MRVTLVSPFDPLPPQVNGAEGHLGGVERVLAEVSTRLASRGHDVTVLCSTEGDWGDRRQGPLLMRRMRRRITVMRTPVAGLAAHLDADADIVHVPATYPFTTAPVLRRAHRLGVPSVLDFHFEPSPPSRLGRMGAAIYRQAGPRAYTLAQATMVRSHAYADSAPSLQHVPRRRLRVVPNGIDPRQFKPDGPRRMRTDLLFVGRLVPYKGVDVLLEALSRIHPQPSLVVAGDGPLRKALEEKARHLYLEVDFLGRVADQDLPALYRSARATVLPSVNGQEAFGITLVESMACGTPVVASDLPGVADVARAGGLVAPPRDPDALAAHLRRVLDPDFALPRGVELARRCHATYSWDAVTDRVEAVYNEVAGFTRTGGVPLATPVGDPVP